MFSDSCNSDSGFSISDPAITRWLHIASKSRCSHPFATIATRPADRMRRASRAPCSHTSLSSRWSPRESQCDIELQPLLSSYTQPSPERQQTWGVPTLHPIMSTVLPFIILSAVTLSQQQMPRCPAVRVRICSLIMLYDYTRAHRVSPSQIHFLSLDELECLRPLTHDFV